MFRKLYLAFIVLLVCTGASAQSQLIFVHDSLDYSNVAIDSSSQVLQVSDTFRNVGGPIFSGPVYLNAKINGGAPIIAFDSVHLAGLDTFPTTDTLIKFHLPVGAYAPSFVSGPNGVIIWPTYRNQPFADSLFIRIYVVRSLGIEEAPLASMYLIQSGGTISVQFGEAQNIVQQVSIYDLNGRMLYTGSEDQSHHIPAGGWSTGIYICEIQTYRGERRTIKFVLQ